MRGARGVHTLFLLGFSHVLVARGTGVILPQTEGIVRKINFIFLIERKNNYMQIVLVQLV